MRQRYLPLLACLLGCGGETMMDMNMDTPDGATFSLTVTPAAGARITSMPAGIDCGATCTFAFPRGTVVELQTEVDGDHVFLRWADACEGDRPCRLVMNESLTLRAVVEDRYHCTQDGWCQ